MIQDTGDSLELQFLENISYIEKTYAVTFSMYIYEEQDKTKHCKKYPYNKHKSYKNCDDLKIKEYMQSKGLNPIWAADKTKNITDSNLVTSNNEYLNLANFYKGIVVYELNLSPLIYVICELNLSTLISHFFYIIML